MYSSVFIADIDEQKEEQKTGWGTNKKASKLSRIRGQSSIGRWVLDAEAGKRMATF